ncbi:hypothetical protein PRIPAC_78395 [Pristionchus pacificus]|uniref:Membrane transporter n=1 Tax=Pristionchus pacificus TaxID=54126 RepID=A0A2A6CNQ2_PRIPA|nr:hypothetical protein PRIPAC_78395 [Pristionchus pacificus]|eukprot:PDM79759.1 membrane transporter [Pristionchus pacificus]
MPSNRYSPVNLDQGRSKSFTTWKRPLVAVVLAFLCNIESGMLAMGEWPYMSTIDHDAASTFFGYATAANKAAHVTFTFVFAIWAYKSSSIRIPMLVGRCITLVGCAMYILVEFIPTNRRWWMLACYVIFGVGFGTSPLLRSYIASATADDNRASAFALLSGANVLSVMIGPIAQMSFAGLPYPGFSIIPPYISIHIYTAPIWFAVIANAIAIVLTLFFFTDTEKAIEEQDASSKRISFTSIREQLNRFISLDVSWTLIAVVILEKMISSLFNTTMSVIVGPLMSSLYAQTGPQMLLLMGTAQIAVGFIAVGFTALFVVCDLGKHVSCRALFAFSNILMIAGYAITYPYPLISNPTQPFNETTRTGCNPLEYSWCDSQLVVNIVLFNCIMVVISGLAIPSTMMSLDTIYSKVIGNGDQSIMQSVFTLADSVMMIVGPIYGSAMFSSMGMSYLQIINGVIYTIGTVLWFAAWKWLQPYN